MVSSLIQKGVYHFTLGRKYQKSLNMADFQAYKQKRNLVNCELRHAKFNYNRNLLNENMDNPRSF